MKAKAENADDIINELTDLEYDDDELTLLDDEEIQPISHNATEADKDVAAFYMEPSAEKQKKASEEEVGLPAKEESVAEKGKQKQVVEEEPHPEPTPEVVGEVSAKEEKQPANIDSYLAGTLDGSKAREEPPTETVKETMSPEEAKAETAAMLAQLENKRAQMIKESAKIEKEETIIEVKPERVEKDDFDKLFNQVNSNIKGAADRVNKHVDIKNKIDERIAELQRLQTLHDQNKKRDFAEINAYKDEVYAKLKAKKSEVEEEMVILKQAQDNFALEKQVALDNIVKKEKELNDAYDNRVKGFDQIEAGLSKRKEQLDAERTAIAGERAKLEEDKKELAENLLKFNQLVDEFTTGVDRFGDNN